MCFFSSSQTINKSSSYGGGRMAVNGHAELLSHRCPKEQLRWEANGAYSSRYSGERPGVHPGVIAQ